MVDASATYSSKCLLHTVWVALLVDQRIENAARYFDLFWQLLQALAPQVAHIREVNPDLQLG